MPNSLARILSASSRVNRPHTVFSSLSHR
jgi:hypothetical protein